MVTKPLEPVSYRPFRVEPVLADGLLPVAREGGELLQRASDGLFRMAAQAGAVADRQAARQGALAGEQAALAGRPDAEYTGIDPAGVAAVGGDHRIIAAGILRKEEGFRATPYWDVNAYRTGYGSDTVTTADGKKVKVTQGMKVSRADADRDLARRLGEFEHTAAGQTGTENWNRLPPATRGALLSVTYNYGSLPKRVVAAVRSGDQGAIASAVAGLSANKARRQREAAIIRGGAAPTGSADGTTTAGIPAATPELTVSGGGYRPGGRDTIYGRAYDEAGTKTYLQLVDSEMRSTTQQLFEQYRDDPAGLEKGLGELKAALRKDHIFPEIEADYDIGFDRLAGAYVGQARENLANKVELQQRADFIGQTNQLETDQQKLLADFDPKSPDAGNAIASAQAAIDDHYEAAVDRGILDPDDAEKAKIESRRNAALGFYGKQADALDAEGVKAMRNEMQADMADGGIAGLDGDGWSTLDASLQKLERVKRIEAMGSENDFRERGDKMALRLLAGVDVNPGELSTFMLDAGGTPGGKQVLQETLSKISAGRIIRDFSLPEAEKHVAGLRKQFGNEPTDAELRTLAFAEKMVADKRRDITTDSVSYAEKQGIVPETPLLTDAGTAEDMAGIMSTRAKSAEQAATELGVPVRYLKAGEAAALGKTIRENPDTGAAMAGAIVAGAGNAAPMVLAEFGKDAPMIAESGAIVAFGGSQRAAEDVILGYGKSPDGKAMKGLKPDAAQQSFREVTGAALTLAREDAARIDRAAASIARKRISEEGLDPASDEAMAVHRQAVQEAAGAVYDRGVQFGGFTSVGGGYFSTGQKVLVPSEIRADRFEDVLFALTDADMAALRHQPKGGIRFHPAGKGATARVAEGPAATIRSATPVAVAGGYAFAAGDVDSADPQWIMAEDGRPFILDLVALRDRLEPRVPGAFR